MKLLLGLAILPAFIIMVYIRRKDKIEKEPFGLLISLFLLGCLSIIPAIVLEVIGEDILKDIVYEKSPLFFFISAFFIVALAEESGKFVMLRLRTWKHKAFDHTFDAVVYAVTVSLGFATLENILYVFSDMGGLETAIVRGLLSVPGHAIDAVFMGCYYGVAKKCEYLGDMNGKRKNLFRAWLTAIMIHGFYDFCLFVQDSTMENKEIFIIVFLVFEVFITIYAIRKIRKLSREDSPIGPPLGVAFNNYQQYYQQNPYYYNAQTGRYEQYVYNNQQYQYNAQQQYQYNNAQPQYQYNTAQQQNQYYNTQQTPQYNNYAQQNYTYNGQYTQQQNYGYTQGYGQYQQQDQYHQQGYNYSGYYTVPNNNTQQNNAQSNVNGSYTNNTYQPQNGYYNNNQNNFQ